MTCLRTDDWVNMARFNYFLAVALSLLSCGKFRGARGNHFQTINIFCLTLIFPLLLPLVTQLRPPRDLTSSRPVSATTQSLLRMPVLSSSRPCSNAVRFHSLQLKVNTHHDVLASTAV